MTLIDLKEDIIHKRLKNFYIFTGTEIGIMNIYLKQMSRVYGMPITRANSVADIYNSCTTRSLFGASKHFYVIRDDTDFTKQEKAYTTIAKDIGNNVIVLLYEKLDSRLKFGKYFKDATVNYEPLDTNVLVKYIQKACPGLTSEQSKYIVEVCEHRYDECMLEADKVNQYADATDTTTEKAFEKLVTDGSIYQPEDVSVFQFVEAVLSLNVDTAFDMERTLRENGTPSITMLGTLYNSMKAVMLIQCCDKGENISEVTGLDKGAIYYNKKYVGKFDTEFLVWCVQEVQRLVSGVKNGQIDDCYATRFALTEIL